MLNKKLSARDYELFARQFNPNRFDAEQWVSLAADAGQKYVVVTCRHHDGFSMYDTALSEYKVTRTPFGRDPLYELAHACARRGDVKLGCYVSLLDWHHPAYRFGNESGLAWSDYIAFLHGQVRELCTGFGELAGIWFDGNWPQDLGAGEKAQLAPGGSFEYESLYETIHSLQPNAVVHNKCHAVPLPGEDIQGFTEDLTGHRAAGFNEINAHGLSLEVHMTINDNWGFHASDHNDKSAQWLVHSLVGIASVGGNYLLNVGPTGEGEILPVQASRLREVGTWLAENGESVYGTRAGSIPPTLDGACVSTRRGDVHYVHTLHYVSDCLKVHWVSENVPRARLLRDGSCVPVKRQGNTLVINLGSVARDPFDTVVRLEP
jgi:alpha-L-fucosidase